MISKGIAFKKKNIFSKTKIFKSPVLSVSSFSANLSASLFYFFFHLKHQTEERHQNSYASKEYLIGTFIVQDSEIVDPPLK
jgi:hypothetical protein